MKTKKFLMTSLLVMGMIIAKAANGFPPELVLVSQPVLTYNANSVTIYYDVQNIGDYTYRGDVYIYLDPDDGYCYAREYVRVCPGRIKRIAISIPAYRPNPSWTYTVMPYYELGDELYSFTTFEYFEPVRFCWYGYRNEPWVVITVGPRPRHYHRPGDYRYYYDGYHPMMPPPPPPGHGPYPRPHDMPPMDPHHHTYGYHHSNGGYPANYHPDNHVPGYNPSEPGTPSNGGNAGSATVRPRPSSNSNSMSSGGNHSNSNNSGSMSSGSNHSSSSGTSSSGRSGNSSSGRSGSSSSSSSSSRPSGNSSSGSNSSSSSSSSSSSVSRPSGNSSSSSSGRPSGNSSSSSVNRPSGNSSSGTSSSGRSGNSSSSSSSSRGGSSRGSSSSSSGRSGNSSGGRR
ncbi:MAG: hypothetical protein J6W30_06825 [Bacteroidales bacterium]|nr:hypothetical protein [Bacteroidales bacterium]